MIMQNLEGYTAIKVEEHKVINLGFADDTVSIAENKEDLQKLLDIVEEESRNKGLELNSKKTEVKVVSRKEECPPSKSLATGINSSKGTNSYIWVH